MAPPDAPVASRQGAVPGQIFGCSRSPLTHSPSDALVSEADLANVCEAICRRRTRRRYHLVRAGTGVDSRPGERGSAARGRVSAEVRAGYDDAH